MNGNHIEQQHGIENSILSFLSEAEMRQIVEAGGGRYVGTMSEIPGKMEPLVLFVSPQTKSTLSLRCSQLTAEAVHEQLAESDAAFSQPSSKCACNRRRT